jgi:hypothetical protein
MPNLLVMLMRISHFGTFSGFHGLGFGAGSHQRAAYRAMQRAIVCNKMYKQWHLPR